MTIIEQGQQRKRIRWRAGATVAMGCVVAAAAMPGPTASAKDQSTRDGSRSDSAPGHTKATPAAAPAAAPARKDQPVAASATSSGDRTEVSATTVPSAATPSTVIVQLKRGADHKAARGRILRAHGEIVGELPIINGFAVTVPSSRVSELKGDPAVRAVSPNAHVKPQTLVNFDPNKMATAFNQSAKTSNLWNSATGRGIGVAVIDTGIAGDLPAFRTSQTNAASRVVASVVTNPNAATAQDNYGHGTHVAGIIGGNDGYRAAGDPLFGKYAGAAPDANLISIKASDDQGEATVLDVIYGLQFAVDHKADYNIRVINLSLESSDPQSYKTDPLDAAVESAWFSGIVVVAAAGNRGTAADAVTHAPGNDPFVITVGAVDDRATKGVTDDLITSWSSRGRTQDGFAKPDIYAPGARIVSQLAPSSAFASMCASCVVSGSYIRAGGTSMSAPIVSGTVAGILEKHPTWTPDQIKGALLNTMRTITGGREIDALNAFNASTDKLVSNVAITPNTLVDKTKAGFIDYTRSSWSRSSWSTAPSSLTVGWARSSWSCTCSLDASGAILSTRSSWSRSSWSTDWTK